MKRKSKKNKEKEPTKDDRIKVLIDNWIHGNIDTFDSPFDVNKLDSLCEDVWDEAERELLKEVKIIDNKDSEKKMTTNTAYLLNTWFIEDSEMWKDVREFINKAHDAHFNHENSGLVEVTFRIIKELSSNG